VIKKRIAILFDNFGPYHLARLRAVAGLHDLLAIQFGEKSRDYAWEAGREAEAFQIRTINPDGSGAELSRNEFASRLAGALSSFGPDVVFVPGWGFRGALLAIAWCVNNRCPFVVMSESTSWDAQRSAWREWVKGRVVGLASAALAGGTPHRAYLEKLGMERGRISVGYDVVDNDFFSLAAVNKSDAAPFFLASARFVKKKNLFSLIKAFSIHVHTAQSSSAPWNLCLLGDGELKGELLEYCSKLGVEVFAHAPWGELDKTRVTLKPVVYMPGFQQIEDLPAFYSRAECFIHASTVEQWGLVVNEAMASSLPVIVSHQCGCAQDLVREGINGFTFDPSNVNELAGLMSRVSSMSEESRAAMGPASQEIIKEWGLARFAAGAEQAISTAIEKSRAKTGWMGRMLVEVLSRT